RDSLSMCDKRAIEEAGQQAKEMIRLSIKAFTERDANLARKLREMDDVVDRIYRDFVRRAIQSQGANLRCVVSGILILRYLERIADHATYIGESVIYIVSGERSSRK
ncbi:MAG: phosphate uptake regulator, PhoU, partial [Nitrososphaerales archaeon]|nr:phosphate uptake regulator, PhoU [Nitrososphaerales archaeon]